MWSAVLLLSVYYVVSYGFSKTFLKYLILILISITGYFSTKHQPPYLGVSLSYSFNGKVKRWSLHKLWDKWSIRLLWFVRSMQWLGVFLLPPGWDASPLQGYPQGIVCQHPFIHLTLREKWFSQEHNTVPSVRAGTWSIEHTSHEAT